MTIRAVKAAKPSRHAVPAMVRTARLLPKLLTLIWETVLGSSVSPVGAYVETTDNGVRAVRFRERDGDLRGVIDCAELHLERGRNALQILVPACVAAGNREENEGNNAMIRRGRELAGVEDDVRDVLGDRPGHVVNARKTPVGVGRLQFDIVAHVVEMEGNIRPAATRDG